MPTHRVALGILEHRRGALAAQLELDHGAARRERVAQLALVDGGIIGPPPDGSNAPRLYLSGPDAPMVAELFAAGALEAQVLDGEPTAASALKMAYAGWTKGTAALLLTMREAARAHGVEDALVRE